MTANLTAHIASAVEIKRQMNAAVLYIDDQGRCSGLYANLDNPDSFQREQADLGKVLTRQYAPAIGKIVAATTHDDLVERRERLDKRLNKGWAYCHLHPDDGAAYDAWEALLVEYTVVSDCLDHIGVINGTLDRIGWIESFVRPLEQGVLV